MMIELPDMILSLAAGLVAFLVLAGVAQWWQIELGVPNWLFVIGGALLCCGLAMTLNLACAIIPPVLMAGLLLGQRIFSD